MTVSTAVKMVGAGRVGGYLVVFGSPHRKDLEGDYFTPETDFALDWYERRPALYHHGLDGTLKTLPVGVIDHLKMDEVGLWAEAQIDLHKRYGQVVQKLVDEGVLHWSSGSLSHLVKRAPDGQLKRWPLIEGSLTPTPAEPRMTDIQTIKSAYKSLDLDVTKFVNGTDDDGPEARNPEALLGAGGAVGDSDGVQNGSSVGLDEVKLTMSDNGFGEILTTVANLKTTLADELNSAMDGKVTAVKDAQKTLEDKITALETKIKNAPAFRGPQGGGAGDAKKSLGEVCLEVKRAKLGKRDLKDGFPVKALTGDTGGEGGYVLDEEFGTQFLQGARHESPILEKVQVMPVRTRSGRFPVMNIFTAASGGDTPLAGGLSSVSRAEGAAHTADDFTLEEVRFNIENAISGKVEVTRELVKDSPVSIEALIRQNIVATKRANLEYYILNGSGVGQPLGLLNSDAIVDVDPDADNTFARADASEMYSHLMLLFGSEDRVCWVTHRSMEAQIDALDANTATSQMLMTGGTPKMRRFIKGYERANTPFVPAVTNSGCVLLVDFAAYVLFQLTEASGEGVEINYFDQISTTHEVWTYDCRMDGQPLVRGSAQFSDAYELSPVIRFND
jgi:HK97 family phage major capsid protein